MRTSTTLLAASALALAGLAHAAPFGGPPPGFEVYSADDAGGGWVHHRTMRGDTFWGCADVKKVETCTQVYFNEWMPTAKFEVLHVTDKSQDAWVILQVPGKGDHLYACGTPEGEPTCTRVDLDLDPKFMTNLERVWPPYETCIDGCGGEGAAEDDDPRGKIESAAYADMWLQLAVKGPGPANLYACQGLGSEPTCQLALPNWLAFDRENLGFKKIEDIKTEGPDGEDIYGPGVLVSKMDEESVAWEAGFREGDVITHVGGFEVHRAAHARNLMLQYPAGDTFVVTMENGETREVTANRKPKKQ